MEVVLHGKFITIGGEKPFQSRFDTPDIFKMDDGVKLSWGLFNFYIIYFDSITTDLDGTPKTYATVDEMYSDYIIKQHAL